MTMIAPISFSLLPPGLAPSAAVSAEQSTGFAELIAAAGRNAIGTMKGAESVAMDGMAGRAGIQDVVDGIMAAERTFNASLAIRDKVVTAWLDVSRMTI
jgi:flagellar hook-basal body complex protein FliE